MNYSLKFVECLLAPLVVLLADSNLEMKPTKVTRHHHSMHVLGLKETLNN